MKTFFWLLPLLLFWTGQYFSSSTYAQTYAPADSVQLQVRSTGDTLVAIHQLFLSKRRKSKIITWTGVGLAAVGGLVGLGSYALVNSVK